VNAAYGIIFTLNLLELRIKFCEQPDKENLVIKLKFWGGNFKPQK
jgi:hypothetical protein